MCLHLSMAKNLANMVEPQVAYLSTLRSPLPSISLILAALPVVSPWKFPINLLGSPVLYMACYLPPAGSKFYDSLNSDGVSLVELELIKLKASYPNYCMILSGDF